MRFCSIHKTLPIETFLAEDIGRCTTHAWEVTCACEVALDMLSFGTLDI